jgi:hypothetical protein
MRRSVLEPVVLSEEERETLERWARRPKARRLWPCGAASSLSAQRKNPQQRRGSAPRHPRRHCEQEATTILGRSLREGLADEPRPGAPRTINDNAVKTVIVKTLEETPLDATHWSTLGAGRAAARARSSTLPARLLDSQSSIGNQEADDWAAFTAATPPPGRPNPHSGGDTPMSTGFVQMLSEIRRSVVTKSFTWSISFTW